MLRLAAIVICFIAVAAGLSVFPVEARRTGPAELPDLSLSPADIRFIDENGASVNDSSPGDILFINVTIRNLGPAESGPFNASFYENGAFLETVAVNESAGSLNTSQASLVWDTSLSLVGLCNITVELACPAGDANLTNNRAVREIELHPVAPLVNITLDPPAMEFDSGSGVGQRITLSGLAEIRMPFGQTAVVHIMPETDNGWACAAQPSFLIFDYPLPKRFSAVMTIPQNATGGMICNLTVKAQAMSGGYSVQAQASSRIRIGPVFGIIIGCEQGYREIRPGGTAVFLMKITNTGNSEVDYNISISNIELLETGGWTISLDRANLTGVRPDETRTVNITARSSDEFSIWHSMPTAILVRAGARETNNTTEAASIRYPVYAYEKGASTWGQVALVLMAPLLISPMLWFGYVYFKLFRRVAGKLKRS